MTSSKTIRNGSCVYTIKGVHVRLKVGWQYEAPPEYRIPISLLIWELTHSSSFGPVPKEKFIPQIYLTPVTAEPGKLGRKPKELRWRSCSMNTRDCPTKGRPFISSAATKADRGGDNLQKIFKRLHGIYSRPECVSGFRKTTILLAKYYVTTAAVALANSHP